MYCDGLNLSSCAMELPESRVDVDSLVPAARKARRESTFQQDSYQRFKSIRFVQFICKIITDMRKKLNATKRLSQVNQEEEEKDRNVPASLNEMREPLLEPADTSQ